ncbi:MAG: DNA/RNA nuclease SfsA [Chloroflexaceae bacterium]|nr:DNA/RNA nuclease SfsA [Chloroflexaceae bacterium]
MPSVHVSAAPATIRIPLAQGAPLVEARFIARPNQFLVEAEYNNQRVLAHMADRGRLVGLLVRGARLLLAHHTAIARIHAYGLVGVYTGDELVSLDTLLPNRLIAAALAAHALPQFARYPQITREVPIGKHRFDFRLANRESSCILEVKSVAQVVAGQARFPDAPTARGVAHVEALRQLSLRGQRTALLFVVQRHTAHRVVANAELDPAFAAALQQAVMHGVEVYANACPITPAGIRLGDALPVIVATGEQLPTPLRSM